MFKSKVIVGNDALLKCDISSHVADFVSVVAWVDSQGVQLGSATRSDGRYGKNLSAFPPLSLEIKEFANLICSNLGFGAGRILNEEVVVY